MRGQTSCNVCGSTPQPGELDNGKRIKTRALITVGVTGRRELRSEYTFMHACPKIPETNRRSDKHGAREAEPKDSKWLGVLAENFGNQMGLAGPLG